MYDIFEQLLQKRGVTTYQVSKATGISQSTFSNWKSRRNLLSPDKAKLIADYFGVSLDYLMTGQETEKSDIILTDKDEKDIQRRIERAIKDLEEQDALMFDGEPLDDATRAALMESLASSIRIAKIQAKQKYGRKKKTLPKESE